MPRNYLHIKDYEKEILKLREEGKNKREIYEIYGFTIKQLTDFITRYNRNQRLVSAGIALKKKGRPCKKDGELPPSIQKLDKLTQMRYVIASKDRQIKRLEMENELMRDFLSLTERK